MSKVLKIVGAPAPSDLGLVKASGGIDGPIEAVTFKQFSVSAEGQTAQVNGTPHYAGRRQGTTFDHRLQRQRDGQRPKPSRAPSMPRVADRPSINRRSQDHHARCRQARDRQSRPLPRRRAARPAAPATAAPIDTSAMGAFDASVKLVAGTLVSSPLRISNADLAITLKDGVLIVSRFKGGLYGAASISPATVDGSKPGRLALDFKGEASNIILGEMLRNMSGSNQFGGSVKVTVDGKLNASGITLKGRGRHLPQVKSSMAGGAQLSGHIFVGADKTLTMIGSAAAGAVGGGDRQYAGQHARRCRPARWRRREQSPQCRVAGAEPLRQPRQPDLGPRRHCGRRAERPQSGGAGRPSHGQHRHAHQFRGLDDRVPRSAS